MTKKSEYGPVVEPLRVLRRDEIPAEIFNKFSSLEKLFWSTLWEVIEKREKEAKEKESGGRAENTAGGIAQTPTQTHAEVSSCP